MKIYKLAILLTILLAGYNQVLASDYMARLRMTGYSENEINDIIAGKRKKEVIDFQLRLLMTGHAPEGYSPLEQSLKNRIKKPDSRSESKAFPYEIMNTYNNIIHQACIKYKINKHLVYAVIAAESGFNPNAVSAKGAIGLMGLMPKTAKQMGCKNPYNPRANIFCGVKYLRKLFNQYGKRTVLVLAAYNAGPNKVKIHNGIPPYKETLDYIKKVHQYFKLFRDTHNTLLSEDIRK